MLKAGIGEGFGASLPEHAARGECDNDDERAYHHANGHRRKDGAFAHERSPMTPITFTSSLVTSNDGKIVAVLFDDEAQQRALAILICSRLTADALQKNVRSALGSSATSTET